MSNSVTSAAPRPSSADTKKRIDGDWPQWIAENRLRDCTPESMLATMVTAGLDREACASAIANVEHDPAYLAARKHQQLQRKLESVLANLQKLWQSDRDYARVEKRAAPTADEFVARYVRGCRPVVLTDLARDWPAMRRWSTQDLKARFGHLEVEIQTGRNADPRYE